MVEFEWNPDLVPKVKLGVHALQIVLSFVVWCMEIAVFRAEDARIVGNNGWTFGVCFLSIPAWLYLIMTPRWERTRRFAEPHAMLTVDALFAVIWLSAFATQAAYNTAGYCGQACSVSAAIVGLGVVIFILFGVTTFISGYTMQYYNFHGTLPGYDARKIGGGGDNIDPDKAAFSMAPHEEEAYQRVNADENEASGSGYGGGGGGGSASAYDTGYGNANPYSHDDDDPSRYGSLPPRTTNTMFDNDTEYNPGVSQGLYAAPAPSEPYASQVSYGGRQSPYDDGPAQFPAGDYDRVHR
ncbi:hypothetical protein S7711_01426 [Stachybotrys chartarum IBT 7711]|uniref:MARVEL domain-containing protein n=1 Tax=Stachybotrys chartarum (strain CBS 109288 / IBT 7711) TaxID=1280523 RepID=A0A084B6X8_STACB|nr:hypothetical protein S7711_01426 [Stachybotrys chartarum IBT 7711]